MRRRRLIAAFHQLIQEKPEGFTLDLDGGEVQLTTGYAVGSGIPIPNIAVALKLIKGSQFIGYWHSCIDIVDWYAGLATAILAGKARGEIAIYDFANRRIIKIEDVNA